MPWTLELLPQSEWQHLCTPGVDHVYPSAAPLSQRNAGRPSARPAPHPSVYNRGDVLDLLDDMLELQPTIFLSVPRLYNRVYDRVTGAIREGNPVARKLFETAYASKRAALLRGDLSGGTLAPLWDRLVFSKVAARLGGEAAVRQA